MNPRLLIGTPLHDARHHAAYTVGLLQTWAMGLAGQWCPPNGTSLMRQRDTIVAQFLKSDCTHVLFVDSDIGWSPQQALALLATGEDFVGGTYCRKMPGNHLTANLTGERKGELCAASHVGTGFLLVSRSAIERMLAANEALRYESAGESRIALFLQDQHEGTEDLSFCRRWREIGGTVWMHTGVVLSHYDGNTPYVADVSELRKPIDAERAQAAE